MLEKIEIFAARVVIFSFVFGVVTNYVKYIDIVKWDNQHPILSVFAFIFGMFMLMGIWKVANAVEYFLFNKSKIFEQDKN